jgi:two-component system capsular synthesis sensor histidine kinase RcsC
MRLRVLLVEDEAMNADLFVDALAPDGHDITVERDGLHGYELAGSQPFDLIVLDMNLPRMSGAEICHSLRANGTKTPILALSASVMPHELEVGLRAGFDAYLTKPIKPAALREAIRRYAKSA